MQGAPFDRLTMAIFFLNQPFIRTNGTKLEGRLLLHAFTVAAAHAQQRYGVRFDQKNHQIVIIMTFFCVWVLLLLTLAERCQGSA